MNQDSELIIFIITGIVLLILISFFIIYFIYNYQEKQAQYKRDKENLQSQFQQESLRTQLEIQEQTLKTISQEIHDNIGQVLSLAKLNLNTMDIAQQEELKGKIIDSKLLVSKAIQDLRDLSKSMNTDHIEAMGLIRAIEYEMEMIRKTGFSAELNVEGKIIRLEPQKELILFRIIQETINNIIKHAEADKIEVAVNYSDTEIKLKIKDNGKGCDLTPLNENDNSGFGLGIRNMHNRAKLIGADFKMSSSIGNGTEVCLTVPLNNHNL